MLPSPDLGHNTHGVKHTTNFCTALVLVPSRWRFITEGTNNVSKESFRTSTAGIVTMISKHSSQAKSLERMFDPRPPRKGRPFPVLDSISTDTGLLSSRRVQRVVYKSCRLSHRPQLNVERQLSHTFNLEFDSTPWPSSNASHSNPLTSA